LKQSADFPVVASVLGAGLSLSCAVRAEGLYFPMSTDELIKRLAWGSGIVIVLAVTLIYATSGDPVAPAKPSHTPSKNAVEKIDVEVVKSPTPNSQSQPSSPPSTSNRPKIKTIFE
jgi:hypothetical protein